jgi:hypothetical protein
MSQDPWWKRELKEIFAISSTFFILFVMFSVLKLALLSQYHIDGFKTGTAIIGSLIMGKVVLIFDNIPLTRRMDVFPNIYRVFFRSFVYLIGFILFSLLEHWVKELIHGEQFGEAWKQAFLHLGSSEFLFSLVMIFVAFLFFNTFWVIRTAFGPKKLYSLFFRKPGK